MKNARTKKVVGRKAKKSKSVKIERRQPAAPVIDGRFAVAEVAEKLRNEARRLREEARNVESRSGGNRTVFDGLLKALEPAVMRKKADGYEAAAEWVEAELLGRSVAPGRLGQESVAVVRQLEEHGLRKAGV